MQCIMHISRFTIGRTFPWIRRPSFSTARTSFSAMQRKSSVLRRANYCEQRGIPEWETSTEHANQETFSEGKGGRGIQSTRWKAACDTYFEGKICWGVLDSQCSAFILTWKGEYTAGVVSTPHCWWVFMQPTEGQRHCLLCICSHDSSAQTEYNKVRLAKGWTAASAPKKFAASHKVQKTVMPYCQLNGTTGLSDSKCTVKET